MLIELAIGDAYGAGFEYAHPGVVARQNTLTGYVQHPKHSITPGCYTDDTQMSIAIAEAMLAEKEWTPELLAQHFVQSFHRDPREGYAGGFYAFLQRTHTGHAFLANIQPESDKSGAAMRAAPIGFCPEVEQVIARSTMQAKLTHDTPDGIAAAVVAALMTHYFLYEHGPKRQLGRFLEWQVSGRWAAPWRGKVGSKGWMSVRAAITAVQEENSLSAMLRRCIDFTGDVDTVATIALAAASCSREVDQDLPEVLWDELEDGAYGRTYLRQLEEQLRARWQAA